MISNTYHLPPEWAPQSGVMLTWPHADSDWASRLSQIEKVFVEMAYQIALREKLIISCLDSNHLTHVSECLKTAKAALENIKLYIAPSDDTWVRDHGPITVITNESPLLLNFKFNAWGGKYQSNRDDQLTKTLQQQGAFDHTQMEDIDLILEGGSIEVDGKGTLLATRRCLLANTRNSHLSPTQLEHQYQKLLGIKRILWLDHGHLAGDDTDSHIDTLARFTSPTTICYVDCSDPQDQHYIPLQTMAEELSDFRNYFGHPYELVPLPWPQAKYNQAGERLPATYANFLIINEAVLVPTYDDPADAEALEILQACFPGREMIGIQSNVLIEQYGAIHCATMQLPEGVLI